MTSTHRSSFLLLVALTPAVLQQSCDPPTGDPTLTLLTVEFDGTNQLFGFTSSDDTYDVWNPTAAANATVTAIAAESTSEVKVSLGQTVVELPTGGGTDVIGIPPGSSELYVAVVTSGDAREAYKVNINPFCGEGDVCDDGNPCTIDGACNLASYLCPPPSFESVDTACNSTGLCDGAGACDPSWGTPQLIDAEMRNALYPRVAVAANGTAVAVWEQLDDLSFTRPDVWGAVYDPATGWGAAELLENIDYIDPDMIPAESPQVAIDAAGNAIAVWEQTFPTGLFPPNNQRTEIWFNRYEPGTGWSGPALAFGEELHDLSLPKEALVSSAQGTTFIAWQDYDVAFQFDSVKASHHVPGTGWAAQVDLVAPPNPGSQVTYAAVDADANGNAFVIWPISGGMFNDFWVRRFTQATEWEPPVRIVIAPGNNPLLAMDGAGNATVAWNQTDGAWAVRFEPATGWDFTPQQINTSAVEDLAAGGGDVFAVWSESEAAAPGTVWRVLASRADQGTWGAATMLYESPQPEISSLLGVNSPLIEAIESGDAVVTWGWGAVQSLPQLGPGAPNLTGARYAAGSGWKPTRELEDNGALGATFSPDIAYGSDGSIIAVFSDGNTSLFHDVWAVRFEPWP